MENLKGDEIVFKIPVKNTQNIYQFDGVILDVDDNGVIECRLKDRGCIMQFTENAVKDFHNISAIKRKRDALKKS